MGITILGWVLVALSVVIIGLGASFHGFRLLSSEFMAYVVGGLALATLGLAIIKSIPPIATTVVLWAAALAAIVYLYELRLDTWLFLGGIVCVIGLAIWLITTLLAR